MKRKYILIDYENVQTKSLERLTENHFKVLVFLGARQASVPVELAMSAQGLGARAEYIRISGRGVNALDFHIAYYIGRLAVEEPSASFDILSKDTGFDPLVEHLRSKNIDARRVKTIPGISAGKPPNGKSPQKDTAVIRARLQKLKKPRTVKGLSNTIALWFPKLSEQQVMSLMRALENQGYLKITGDKVTYASNGLTKALQRNGR